MLRFFKRIIKKEQEENRYIYKIAFCDENDISTKFGEWDKTFETYQSADFAIRMNWNKNFGKEKDGYKILNSWLVIEKIKK